MKIIVTVGISGSGKSHWIQQFLYKTENEDLNIRIISPDDIRKEMTGSVSDQSNNRQVWETAFRRLKDAISTHLFDIVIFDSTMCNQSTIKALANHVDLSKVNFAVFPADPELSKRRIEKDLRTGRDRSAVPDDVIDKQFARYKDLLPFLETFAKDNGAIVDYIH